MSLKKSKLAMAMAAAAGLTFSSGAFATNGIIQAGNGMVAHGMGGAGLANASEAASGMDNPALISQTGDSISVAWSMFAPDREADFTDVAFGLGDAKSDAKLFAIPQIAFTSKISDSLSWGIMAYALGGMNTDYREDPFSKFWAGFLYSGSDLRSSSVDLSGMIIAPTLSFKVNKDIDVGASLLIGYENLRLRNMFGLDTYANFVGASTRQETNEGSAVGYGAKLGVNWRINDGIAVGVIVQPKMSMDEISYFKDVLKPFGFTGDAGLALPNEFGVGGKFAVGKTVDINADLMYYQWKSVDVFEFFGWDNQIVYKLGAEWRATDKLALRAGFNYGKSPIQGDAMSKASAFPIGDISAVIANYMFPAISEQHYTVGLGYKMDKNLAVNAYYLYSPKTTITDTTGSGGALSMSQNAFGLGVNYTAK